MMLSVVICTYNRSELLSKCLESLTNQTLDKKCYEVIVADNNSTDNTVQVAHGYIGRLPNLEICREEKRGANHTRNAGVGIAKGEYIAFIDDDALADPDWLLNISEFIGRHPDIHVFGGPHDAFTLVPKPDWFPPEYGIFFLGNEERPVDINVEWLIGTNFIVRKDAFVSVGGFNEKLGSIQTGISFFQAGEETRLLIDLSARGHIIYYVPSVKVTHLIRTDKMRLTYLLVSGYRMGRNHNLTLNVRRSLSSHLVSLSATIVKAIIKIGNGGNIPVKRKLYYALYPFYYEAGAFIEYIAAHAGIFSRR